MSISTNSTYIPTMDEFIPHWAAGNVALAPATLVIRLLDNTTRTQAEFIELRDDLEAKQDAVQSCLTAEQIERSVTLGKKVALLAQLNLFIGVMDSYYQNTRFYVARPYAPMVTAGREAFTEPLKLAVDLWTRMNAGTAPTGVTLPLVLPDETDVGAFEEALEELNASYKEERRLGLDTTLARGDRNKLQDEAYEVMKLYRETVPTKLVNFPVLVDSLPRLTPLPGHTPQAVNASAVFEAPNSTRVVYDASSEATLERYELRGTVGDHYDEEDAVVIATNEPGDPREFVTQFGLNQPGAEISLKVFVILTTGNEAGSASMEVERPANVQLLAA